MTEKSFGIASSLDIPFFIHNEKMSIIIFFIIFTLLSFVVAGCQSETPIPPRKAVQAPSSPLNSNSTAAMPQQETIDIDLTEQEGYVYEQRGRRDPFVPLIVPTEKWQKKDASKIGTLEGYDLSEFAISAIARKGSEFFALLVTPDNRSFTVKKGSRIGLSRGKVQNISEKKVILTENTKNFRGELRPREIILELHKGEE